MMENGSEKRMGEPGAEAEVSGARAKAGLSYQPKTQRCVTPKASRMK